MFDISLKFQRLDLVFEAIVNFFQTLVRFVLVKLFEFFLVLVVVFFILDVVIDTFEEALEVGEFGIFVGFVFF